MFYDLIIKKRSSQSFQPYVICLQNQTMPRCYRAFQVNMSQNMAVGYHALVVLCCPKDLGCNFYVLNLQSKYAVQLTDFMEYSKRGV